MGNSRSQLQLQEEEINEITAETGFTKQQVRMSDGFSIGAPVES